MTAGQRPSGRDEGSVLLGLCFHWYCNADLGPKILNGPGFRALCYLFRKSSLWMISFTMLRTPYWLDFVRCRIVSILARSLNRTGAPKATAATWSDKLPLIGARLHRSSHVRP